MNAIIQTRGLTHRYNSCDAVSHLDLAVPQGSIFALLGPNGAGKTTTIKVLMNILEPTAGTAEVLGAPSTRLGPAEFRRIGYVSENQELPEWMTVRRFLDYCRGFYPDWDDAFCAKMLEQFDLPPDRKLKHLSRGMKMKAALLSSLAYRPKLLVLDEPFSGLDPLARDEFISGMLTLVGESDWTILISSHDIEEVERLVDWVAFLDAGRLQLCEPVAALQERFRRMQGVLEGPPPAGPPPLPEGTWVGISIASHSLTCIESRYVPGESEARLRERFPSAHDIQAQPMSLREIFVALARRAPAANSLKP